MRTPTITLLFMCSHCMVQCLDSNVIRSSKEALDPSEQEQERPQSATVGVGVRNNARRRVDASSNRQNASSSRDTCNRPMRKSQTSRDRTTPTPDDDQNQKKAPEMATCVRSGDCEAGLCCVRYLKEKRCKRIPVEEEACLLRGRSKQRRNLDRCDCGPGLVCRARPESPKGQGVCQPKQRNQRRARHSGKRRVAQRPCG